MLALSCPHTRANQKRLLFACEDGGNYTVDLCKNCEIKEGMKFLIKEMPLEGKIEV